MTADLTLGIYALWDAIPFGVDTWPDCAPWERAGVATLWDQREVEAWAQHAQRELALEVDRRFDALEDWLEEQTRPRARASRMFQ